MASKFKEGDKIVLNLDVLPGSNNGSSFYLSETMNKYLRRNEAMEVFVVDGNYIKIVGCAVHWYCADWFTLVEAINKTPYHLHNGINIPIGLKDLNGQYVIKTEESEQIMVDSSKAVEQVTFIYGTTAANVTDDNIFEMIRVLESKIENSSKIKNKPKKLETQIESYKAEIDELVKFVDAR